MKTKTAYKKAETKKKSVAEIICERLIAKIKEEKKLPWERTFLPVRPFNYISRKQYRGINLLLLQGCYAWITQKQLYDYNVRTKEPRTFKVVDKDNWSIACFYKVIDRELTNEEWEDYNSGKHVKNLYEVDGELRIKYFILRYTKVYPVDNIADDDGNPLPDLSEYATMSWVEEQGYATESWVASNFTLPTASASVLGGIKVGSGLTIDANGVLTNAITATASVDSNTGNPSVAVTINNGNISFAFSNLKGDQGNTGSSVDYPYELVNNLTTDDSTKGLTAAMGKRIGDNISQLGQEVIIDGAERSEFAYSQLSSATPNIQLPTSIAFEQVGDFVEIKAKAKDAGFLFRRNSSYNQPRIKYEAANTLTIRMTSADSAFSLQNSSVNWATIQTIKILLAAHPTDTTWNFEYYLDGSKIGTKTVTTSGAAAFFNQIGYRSTADVYYVRGITNGVPFAYTKLSEIQSATGITDIYDTVSVPSLLKLDNRLGIAEQGIAALKGKVDGEDMFYSYRKSVSTYNISSAFYIYQRLKNDIYTRTTIGYYNYSGSAGHPNGYWRIERINIGTIINGVWTNIQEQVITAGENEFVLQWLAGTGYNFSGGFSGGFHFGEKIADLSDAWVEFVMDGKRLSTDVDIPLTPCKSFYYREYSAIYQHNDNTIAAWHLKESHFWDGG